MNNDQKASLLVQAAYAAVQEGDPTGALQMLVRAEDLSPKYPMLHYVRGIAFFSKRLVAEAIVSAKRAVELDPSFSDGHNTLGKMLLENGQYREAEVELLKAAKDPLYRDAFKSKINLGILFYKQSEFAQARNYFDQAIQDSPAGACMAYYYRGNLQLKENHLSEAIRDYDFATRKLCANFADAHLALGIAYQRNGLHDKARKKFLSVRELFPESPAAEQAMTYLRDLP